MKSSLSLSVVGVIIEGSEAIAPSSISVDSGGHGDE